MNRRNFCLTLGAGLLGSFVPACNAWHAEPVRTFLAKKIFLPDRQAWSEEIESLNRNYKAWVVMSGTVPKRMESVAEKKAIALFRPVAGLPRMDDLSGPVVPLTSTADFLADFPTGFPDGADVRPADGDGFLLGDSVIVLFDVGRRNWTVFARHAVHAPADRISAARFLDRLRRSGSKPEPEFPGRPLIGLPCPFHGRMIY